MPVLFGQVIIGPPGAGKTTYCEAMSRFLQSLGRPVALINLDPANESVPYKADIDVSDLIQLEDVMDHYKLGPNGGLVYCMEYLEQNLDWLLGQLHSKAKGKYVLIDFPGQVELYTHNECVRKIIDRLEKEAEMRLCAVHLVDAHYCSDASKFVAVCLTALNAMLRIELPHINILSKVDLIEKYGKLDFGIDFYTEVLDLNFLVDRLPDDPFMAKFKKLNEAITGLVTDYALVNFMPLSVNSKEQMLAVKNAVDKANGYCFGSAEERNLRTMLTSAFSNTDFEYAKTGQVREQFMKEGEAEEEEENEPLGNDLDKVDIGPGFQV